MYFRKTDMKYQFFSCFRHIILKNIDFTFKIKEIDVYTIVLHIKIHDMFSADYHNDSCCLNT